MKQLNLYYVKYKVTTGSGFVERNVGAPDQESAVRLIKFSSRIEILETKKTGEVWIEDPVVVTAIAGEGDA